MTLERRLSVADVCARTGLTRDALYHQIKRGWITYHRDGARGRYWFLASELEADAARTRRDARDTTPPITPDVSDVDAEVAALIGPMDTRF